MNRHALFVLPLALFACTETVESTDVRTSGIYPEFRVVADGSGNSEASARLKVGGNDSNTFLDLQSDDRLEVTVAGETRRLEETGSHRYTASFPTDAAGTEFSFAFVRGEQDDGAAHSVVTLPAPFELVMASTQASRATDAVGFNWTPPDSGELHWDLEGDCVWTEEGVTPDDGSHSLNLDQVRAHASDETESCSVQLTVQRSRSGSIDAAFTEGGENIAYQARAQLFTSMP
jgi:hypothetical protein